jgi:hypothetical protein
VNARLKLMQQRVFMPIGIQNLIEAVAILKAGFSKLQLRGECNEDESR